ncbi:DUF4397 domain-containing protein [Halorarius litoreus]|uniref:DUF4397 domain-containing protein n=1 Tax=Halorarius litoreus TaxID=2962676 RepID=UPI0020CC5276|nr:DUF4397 domain-containing protein [Halorarius litoreus]
MNRRRFLVTSGALGIATLVAGCGSPGTGVGTGNGTTTADGGVTTSPTEGGEMTETTTEAPETETEGETEAETETEAGGDARVRVAHLSPNAPNVDVYVDDSAVLEDVAFGTVSDYLEVAAGAHTVEITAAGDPDTSVFEGEVTAEAGTDYTVAAIGEVGEDADQPFEPLVLMDNNEAPDSETARVRAVHASPDAPAVDITAGDTVLFDGVAYGGSGDVEVPAGDYTVEIRGDTPENDGEVAASFDLTLEGGTVYSAFAAGYLTPDDEPASTPFDLIVTQDSGGA